MSKQTTTSKVRGQQVSRSHPSSTPILQKISTAILSRPESPRGHSTHPFHHTEDCHGINNDVQKQEIRRTRQIPIHCPKKKYAHLRRQNILVVSGYRPLFRHSRLGRKICSIQIEIE